MTFWRVLKRDHALLSPVFYHEVFEGTLKLTWHLKMDGWNTSFLLGWPIFRGYVSFRECSKGEFGGIFVCFTNFDPLEDFVSVVKESKKEAASRVFLRKSRDLRHASSSLITCELPQLSLHYMAPIFSHRIFRVKARSQKQPTVEDLQRLHLAHLPHQIQIRWALAIAGVLAAPLLESILVQFLKQGVPPHCSLRKIADSSSLATTRLFCLNTLHLSLRTTPFADLRPRRLRLAMISLLN